MPSLDSLPLRRVRALWPLVAMGWACSGPPPTRAPVPSTSGLAIYIPHAPERRVLRQRAPSLVSEPESAMSAVVIDRRQLAADGQELTIRDIPVQARHLQVGWLGADSSAAIPLRISAAPVVGDRVQVQTDDDTSDGRLLAIDADTVQISSSGDTQRTAIARASVRDIRALGVSPEVRTKRPSGAGEQVLMELSYLVPKLSWSASYRLHARAVDDRFEVAIRPHFTIHNGSGHKFPEADIELVDAAGAAPVWSGRQALPESSVRVRWPAPGRREAGSERAEPGAAAGISLTGRLELVARLHHQNAFSPPVDKPSSSAVQHGPRVTRELVLPLPPGHSLAAAPAGWAQVRLSPSSGAEEHLTGPLKRERAVRSGTESIERDAGSRLRVVLGPAPDLAVSHRQKPFVQDRGTVHRHSLTLRNRGERDVSVRVIAPIPNSRACEVLSTGSALTARTSDRLEFIVTVAAGEEEKLRYSIFYPG